MAPHVKKESAEVKAAYEFLERVESQTWCRKTQMEIQEYLRKVGFWPANEDKKEEEPVEL